MWIVLAILASICYAGVSASLKHLETQGIPSAVSLCLLCLFPSILYFFHATYRGLSFKFESREWIVVLLAGVLSYIANLFNIKALAFAPNPGYAVAVGGTQAVVLCLAAYFIFGSELSSFKLLGVGFCILGVSLLSL